MRKLIRYFSWGIYILVLQWLPVSHSLVQIGQRQLRGFFCRQFMAKCGEKVNIERRARFSSRVELGNYSGIGVHALISGKCIIGDNVMMDL